MSDVNLVLSLPPGPFTVAMIASAIPAAIRSYSILLHGFSDSGRYFPGKRLGLR
jgi:hypothetical protein